MSAFNLGSRPALFQIGRRVATLACVTFVLTACGGGGGGGNSGGNPPTSNPPTNTPSADDQAKAQNAKVRMSTVHASLLLGQTPPTSTTLLLDVTWLDTFDNETGYKIERRAVGSNTWQVLETFPAVDGGSVRWQGLVDNSTGSGAYRVSATLPNYSVPLFAAPGESEINVEVTLLAPELQTAPDANGGLRVSLADAAPAQSVDYFLGAPEFNSVQVGSSTSGPDFAVTLPPNRIVTDAAFSLGAIIHKSAGFSISTSILLAGGNLEPALLLKVAPTETANSLTLTARASAPDGVETVRFLANGQLLQELNTPDRFGNWVHTIDPANLPSNATFRAVATDANGDTASMDVDYANDAAVPALSVEGPFDGMIISDGKLNIHGTFGANVPGTVLSVDLDFEPALLRTRTSPFNLDLSFGSRTGDRILTVRAESPTGKVNTRSYRIVLPSTARTYELIGTDVADILAADAGALLYRKHSGALILRTAAGVETQVQAPPGMSFAQWWLADGKIVAEERVNHHLHVFTGPGQTLDLTPQWNIFSARPQLSVRGHWLSFASNFNEFSAHDLTTGVTVRIPVASSQPQFQSDIDIAPGNERVLFPATMNGTAGIYAYGLNTGMTDLLLSGAYDEVLTDGARLAVRAGQRLDMAPLSNPTAITTLVNAGSLYALKDGLIGFSNTTDGVVVAVHNGTMTIGLAVYGGWDKNSIADGYVVFSAAGQMHSWSPGSGDTLIVDALVPTLHTQGAVYLLTGKSPGALYRTTLP